MHKMHIKSIIKIVMFSKQSLINITKISYICENTIGILFSVHIFPQSR